MSVSIFEAPCKMETMGWFVYFTSISPLHALTLSLPSLNMTQRLWVFFFKYKLNVYVTAQYKTKVWKISVCALITCICELHLKKASLSASCRSDSMRPSMACITSWGDSLADDGSSMACFIAAVGEEGGYCFTWFPLLDDAVSEKLVRLFVHILINWSFI